MVGAQSFARHSSPVTTGRYIDNAADKFGGVAARVAASV